MTNLDQHRLTATLQAQLDGVTFTLNPPAHKCAYWRALTQMVLHEIPPDTPAELASLSDAAALRDYADDPCEHTRARLVASWDNHVALMRTVLGID